MAKVVNKEPEPQSKTDFLPSRGGRRRCRPGVIRDADSHQALANRPERIPAHCRGLGLPVREISLIRGALAEIPAEKKAPSDVAAVSPEERSALFAALPLRVRLVAETLYVTGTRVLEVLGVRRDQVKVNSTNYLLWLSGLS